MPLKKRICWLWAAGCLLLLPVLSQAQTGVEAITKPSQDRKLSFVRPGIIDKVLVKEGQEVKEGELLVKQDDSAEMAQLDQLKADSQDRTRVNAAKSQLAQKKVDLQKLEEALKKGASTDLEVEHARLDVTIAEYQLQVEEFQCAQNARKQKELELQIARMQIKSPIDGRVEEIFIKQGEGCGQPGDAMAKVVRVVKIDPLWVDAPMPLAQTDKIQQTMDKHEDPVIEVAFGTIAAEGAKAANPVVVKGKVIFMAAVADGASATRMVRVEVPNPTGRPAGEHVEVRLTESVAAPAAASAK